MASPSSLLYYYLDLALLLFFSFFFARRRRCRGRRHRSEKKKKKKKRITPTRSHEVVRALFVVFGVILCFFFSPLSQKKVNRDDDDSRFNRIFFSIPLKTKTKHTRYLLKPRRGTPTFGDPTRGNCKLQNKFLSETSAVDLAHTRYFRIPFLTAQPEAKTTCQ